MANDAPIISVGKNINPRTEVPVRIIAEDVSITIDNNISRGKNSVLFSTELLLSILWTLFTNSADFKVYEIPKSLKINIL